MQSVLKAVLAFLDAISVNSGRLFAYLSLPVIIIIIVEVIGRYLFNHPFIWAHESMTFMSAFVYMLGGGYVLLQRQHIGVDILIKKFSTRGQAIINIFASLFFFIYIYALGKVTFQFASTSLRIMETSGTPWNPAVYPLKIALLVSIMLILLAGIANLIRDLNIAITGKEDLEYYES
jgi:TRAP-type mannitol/chloroaromatic compound transport system permease small subunit